MFERLMDNNNKIEFPENSAPSDNESDENTDLFQMCTDMMMKELGLEIEKNAPDCSDNALFVVPREIKSEIGTAIMVIDFIYDLSGKCFDAEANDDNPFLDGEMMKAMMRDLPEQELSVMVRGLVDPVLRGFAEEALAEIARRARAMRQKRIGREVSVKSRPRKKWTQ
jgi:hypothetical protein